jgi:hypothetical protein
MCELTDLELDERLSELERDLGPALRAVYRRGMVRADFARQVRLRVFTTGSTASWPRPALRVIHLRGWAALAAMLVGAVVAGGAVLANQPRPVRGSAADVLDQLQAEAFGAKIEGEGLCPGPGVPQSASGTLVIESRAPGAGPVTVTNASDLSERLAKALGVSGDRVRQAMIATVQADMATAPPEPISTIAQKLGKTPAEVFAAFFDPQSAGGERLIVSGSTASLIDGAAPRTEAVISLGGKPIKLSSARAEELSGPAQRLGVSPEQLLAAVKTAVPSTPPPPPRSEDEIIKRLAQQPWHEPGHRPRRDQAGARQWPILLRGTPAGAGAVAPHCGFCQPAGRRAGVSRLPLARPNWIALRFP